MAVIFRYLRAALIRVDWLVGSQVDWVFPHIGKARPQAIYYLLGILVIHMCLSSMTSFCSYILK